MVRIGGLASHQEITDLSVPDALNALTQAFHTEVWENSKNFILHSDGVMTLSSDATSIYIYKTLCSA